MPCAARASRSATSPRLVWLFTFPVLVFSACAVCSTDRSLPEPQHQHGTLTGRDLAQRGDQLIAVPDLVRFDGCAIGEVGTGLLDTRGAATMVEIQVQQDPSGVGIGISALGYALPHSEQPRERLLDEVVGQYESPDNKNAVRRRPPRRDSAQSRKSWSTPSRTGTSSRPRVPSLHTRSKAPEVARAVLAQRQGSLGCGKRTEMAAPCAGRSSAWASETTRSATSRRASWS